MPGIAVDNSYSRPSVLKTGGGEPPESRSPPGPTVIGILRQHVPEFVQQQAGSLTPHVANILARISLCRTAALGRHTFRCGDGCQEKSFVYNSCGERSCPVCAGGGRRVDWLERMRPLVLSGLHFYQVVFTLPGKLSWLILANPEKLYNLMMVSAWKAIRKLMRRLGIQPAATLVLHTWNQRLGHHPHIHVLIPAGGISLDGKRWVSLEVPDLNLAEPNLAAGHAGNQLELGQRFRQLMIKGMVRLYRRSELHLPEKTCHFSSDTLLTEWLQRIAPGGYGVFVEPPPSVEAKPQNILNYIGRYVTGGPISDWRILSHENGIVTFKARSLDRTPGEKRESETIELPGVEFVRRWVKHILPKGFVRSRHYGNFANRNRGGYLESARKLLDISTDGDIDDDEPQLVDSDFDSPPDADAEGGDQSDPRAPRCPKCGRAMKKVEGQQ